MKRETRLFTAISFLLLGACGTEPSNVAGTDSQANAALSGDVSSETAADSDSDDWPFRAGLRVGG